MKSVKLNSTMAILKEVSVIMSYSLLERACNTARRYIDSALNLSRIIPLNPIVRLCTRRTFGCIKLSEVGFSSKEPFTSLRSPAENENDNTCHLELIGRAQGKLCERSFSKKNFSTSPRNDKQRGCVQNRIAWMK